MAEHLEVWRFGGGPGGGDGPLCRVEVHPDKDSVKSVKARIEEAIGVPCARQRLVQVGCKSILDEETGTLGACCDVTAGVQLVVIDIEEHCGMLQRCARRQLVQARCSPPMGQLLGGAGNRNAQMQELGDERLRLPFDDAQRLGFDAVSGWSGEFLNEEQMRAVAVQGRLGIEFAHKSALRLPRPVQLDESWTISFWTLAPIPERTWCNLLDGVNPDTCIAVCFQKDRLGDYAAQQFLDGFRASTLPEGWHHFAVVGAEGSTRYYLDGELLGCLAVQTRGTIGAVGNRADGAVWEAFGVLSDLRIFGAAACREQVQELAGQRLRKRDVRRDLLELTLML